MSNQLETGLLISLAGRRGRKVMKTTRTILALTMFIWCIGPVFALAVDETTGQTGTPAIEDTNSSSTSLTGIDGTTTDTVDTTQGGTTSGNTSGGTGGDTQDSSAGPTINPITTTTTLSEGLLSDIISVAGAPVTVSGSVFRDFNENHVWDKSDSDESTIQMGSIAIYADDGEHYPGDKVDADPVAPDIQNFSVQSNGTWQADLPPGDYWITIENLDTVYWYRTYPDFAISESDYHFVSCVADNITDLDFGVHRVTYDFKGYKEVDENGDGVITPGVPPIRAGWTVYLDEDVPDPTTGKVDGNYENHYTRTTNASGKFEFIGFSADSAYRVREAVTDDPTVIWTQTWPNSTSTNAQYDNGLGAYYYFIPPQDPACFHCYSFGNFQNVTVSGNVYNDLAGNNTKDGTDPGLEDWTVTLTGTGGTTTTTGPSGDYAFTNVGPGSHTISETVNVKPGWLQTEPLPVPPATYTFTPTSGTDVTGKNFGNRGFGTIRGVVYNDLNANWLLETGEPRLTGWKVTLSAVDWDQVISMNSGASGEYEFNNLAPGTYQIEETINGPEWSHTSPIRLTKVLEVSGKDYVNVIDADFGNDKPFLPKPFPPYTPGGGILPYTGGWYNPHTPDSVGPNGSQNTTSMPLNSGLGLSLAIAMAAGVLLVSRRRRVYET